MSKARIEANRRRINADIIYGIGFIVLMTWAIYLLVLVEG